MLYQIQLRRDTLSNWTTNNPVLRTAEIGLITDQEDLQFVIGDGTSLFTNLTVYHLNPSGGGGGGGDISVIDNLTSDSTTDALSANQGRLLKSFIDGGYVFKGFATCATTPPNRTPYPICYIGVESGHYVDFYGNPLIPLQDGQVVFLSRRANQNVWDINVYTISTGSGGGGSSVVVVDNLLSTSTTSALSANQGRVLKDLIDSGQISVVNNLTSESSTAALSANQGRVLKSFIDAGYVFKGVLDPFDDGTPVCDYPVCYISGKSGRYPGYGDLNVNLSDGELAVIYRAKNATTWSYKKTKISVPSGGGGTSGENGGYYEQIFAAVAAGSSAPALPTNYITIDDTGLWKHYIDDAAASQLGDYEVWMATRWVEHSTTPGVWMGPWNISGPAGQPGADGDDIEFIYTRTRNEQDQTPSTPTSANTQAPASISAQQASDADPAYQTSYQKADWYPVGWTDNPQGVTSEIRLEWMSFRTKTGGAGGVGGTWGPFSAPVVWSAYGHQGVDGDGVEYIFAVGLTAPTGNASPDQWTNLPGFQNHEFIPTEYASVWKDNPIDIETADPGTIQWVSMRKKYADSEAHPIYGLNPYWHAYSEPAFWNNKARDGVASAAVVDLSPDMMYVPVDGETGLVSAAFTGTTKVTVQYAGSVVQSATIGMVTVKDTRPTPNSYNWASVSGNNVTISIPSNATVNFKETQIIVTIPVTFTINGNTISIDAVLTVVGNSLGENGVSYQLKTNASIIRRRSNVSAPSEIQVSCIKVEADTTFAEFTPVATANTQAISAMGSGFALTYITDYGTAQASNEIDMATARVNSISTANITDNIVVRLKYNSLVIIQEYIPVAVEPETPETQEVLKSIVFKRGVSVTQPGTGTNRSGSSAADANGTTNSNYGGGYPSQDSGDIPIPYGWYDGVPPYDNSASQEANRLWMTTRIFTSNAGSPQQSAWTTPAPASDTESYDIEFAEGDTFPATPNANNRHKDAYPYGYDGQVWFDPDLDKYDGLNHVRDFSNMAWMAISERVNGVNTTWTIVRIKGETGDTGIDGKDALQIRMRNWNDLVGATLTGDNKVFSGFEEWTESGVAKRAPFRDVIVISPQDFDNQNPCPFYTNDATPRTTPVLLVVNYSSSYPTGYPTVGLPTTSPQPALLIPFGAATASSRNWDTHLCQDKQSSQDAWETFGFQYEVFSNLGPVYTQILVATQAYIGNLTVKSLNTAGDDSSINKKIVASGNTLYMTDETGEQRFSLTGDPISADVPSRGYLQESVDTELIFVRPDPHNSFVQTSSFTKVLFEGISVNTGDVLTVPSISLDNILVDQHSGQDMGYAYFEATLKLKLYRGTTFLQDISSTSIDLEGSVDHLTQILAGGTFSSLTAATNYRILLDVSYTCGIPVENTGGQAIYRLYNLSPDRNAIVAGSARISQIGANGLAVHLGNNFDVIAALDGNNNPVICLQGQASNSQIVGIKISSDGLQLKLGSQNWRTMTVDSSTGVLKLI